VTNDYLGGLIAFGIFAGPAALIMLISGLTFKYMDDVSFEIPYIYKKALAGFQCASVCFVAQVIKY
jgi:hypothetical protein